MTLSPALQSHIIIAILYGVLFLIGLTVFGFDWLALTAGALLGAMVADLQAGIEHALTKEAR